MADIIVNNEFSDKEYNEITDEELLKQYQNSSEVFDAMKTYLREISVYKTLSRETFIDLFIKYKNGDNQAKEKIILANLRLVIYVIKLNCQVKSQDDFLDLIQEGNLGLIRALEKFDLSFETSFSTYAYNWIKQKVHRNFNFNTETIRIPVHLREKFHKFLKYNTTYYKKYGVEPSIEEIKKQLNLTDSQIAIILHVKDNINNIASLNTAMDSEDKDSNELEDFVPSVENGYKEFHNTLSSTSTFYYLKNKLEPKHYYILYYRIYLEKPLTLESIAEKLGLTRERIRQIEKKALNKTKMLLKKPVPDVYNITEKDLLPFPFEKTIIMLYLKEFLTSYEYYIFYNIWYKEKNFDFISNNLETIKSIYQNILDNYSYEIKTHKGYKKALDKVLSIYSKNDIFGVDISPSYDETKDIMEEEINNLNYHQIITILGDDYYQMSDKEQELIEHFFNPDLVHIYPSHLEKAFIKPNLIELGYSIEPKKIYISKDKLYNTYLENKDEFSSEAQELLETSLFYSFTNKKTNFKNLPLKNIYYHILRLELMYYNLDNLFEMRIPNDELLEIINNPFYKFDEKKKACIYLKFIEEWSINDIAQEYNTKKEDMRDFVWNTYDYITNIALNKNNAIKINNEERYYEYIMNYNYDFTPQTREACRLFFFEYKDYDYIKEQIHVDSTTKVSNMITEAIHKMDFWYYGITYDSNLPMYPKEYILEVLNQDLFSEQEKELIIKRYIELIPIKTLCKTYNIDFISLFNLMKDFNDIYKNYFTNYKLNTEDIFEEYNNPTFESCLDELERKFISLKYGIKSIYNSEGIKHSNNYLSNYFNFNPQQLFNFNKKINRKIYKHKFGFTYVNFETFKKSELIDILKDHHLPLSDFEIEIIKDIKGIDRDALNYKEIAIKHGVNGSSIIRRLHRAYVNIKKYLAHEIEGKIVYELDVQPYLRYFPKYEQTILYQRFSLNWTDQDFAKNYNISIYAANPLFSKVEKKLFYLIKYPDAKRFDFDYARCVIHKDDLPFHGNKDNVINLYNRYFGDDGKEPQSFNEMNMGSSSTLLYYVKNLMLAVLKYKDGIRKPKTLSIEEIKEFYKNYKDTISHSFEHDLRKVIENDGYRGIALPEYSLYRILKTKETMPYSSETSIEEIKNFLISNPYHLSKTKLNIIRRSFNIPRRFLMNGKEKNKLIKLLTPYLLKYRYEIEKKQKKASIDARKTHETDILYHKDHENDVKTIAKHYFTKNIDNVLIVDQNLEYIYAYIINFAKKIDFLSKNELIKLLFYLEKHIILNTSFEEGKNILLNGLSITNLDSLSNLDAYIKAYFIELVKLNNKNVTFNPDLTPEDYIRRHYNVSTESNYRLKCRLPNSEVNFIKAIEHRYHEINLGRMIDRDLSSFHKDDILTYIDYLDDNGTLLANFTPNNITEAEILFKGLNYELIPFKTLFRPGTQDALIKVKK